jgi:uncharacterized protein (TIGR00369 family)
MIERPRVNNLFGEEPFHQEDGLARWRYVVRAEHFNPVGALHGGVLSALLDGVQGHALWTRIAEHGLFSAAATLNISFLGATREAGGTIIFEGRALQVGKRIAFTEGVATEDASGRVLARASSTYALIKK